MVITKAKAAKACLAAVAAPAVALTLALAPVMQTSVQLTPELAAKLATVGGTGNPTAKNIETLVGGTLAEGRTVQAIYTPQQFAPVNGSLTLDESVMEGTDNVVAWALVETDQDLVLVTVSQGSVVVSRAIGHWNSNPESAPSPEHLSIILLANPMRPNGGVLARFPGLSLFGVKFYGPTPESEYQVTDSAFAYDLYAVAPLYLNNPLSWINALAGIAVPYNGGNSLHGTDPDYTNPDLDVRTEVYGNTTYHTIFPKNLPMLEPLRMAGLGGLADVIQPVLKVWIDAGYYKGDPSASPGVHMPAELFMPIENVIRALMQTPGAIQEGLASLQREPEGVENQQQPSQTDEPPVDDASSNRTMSFTSDMAPDPSDNHEGGENTIDSSQQQPPVDTSGQGGDGPSDQIVVTTGGGENGGQVTSPNQSQGNPNNDLPKEGSEGDKTPESPKDEVKKDDDDEESTRLSDDKKDEDKDKDDDKKDGKKDEDSPESKPSKPESPSTPSNAGNNGNGPSGAAPSGNEDNDKPKAA